MVPTVFFSFLSFLFFLSFLSFFLSQPLHTAHCNRTWLAGNPQNKRRCSGWWLTYLPLWKIMEFVSWDFLKFPTKWKVIKFMFQITNQIIWTLGMVHCHVWLPEGTSNVIPFRMITAILLTWDLLPPKSHDYIWKSSSCVDLGDPYQLHPKKIFFRNLQTCFHWVQIPKLKTIAVSQRLADRFYSLVEGRNDRILIKWASADPSKLISSAQIWPDPRSVPSCFFLSEELDELEDDEDELEDELEEELFLSMGWVHGVVNRKPWLSLYHMF